MSRTTPILATIAISAAKVAGLVALTTTISAAELPDRWLKEWPETDFSVVDVNPEQIVNGGVPRDGIPAITGPDFHTVAEENALDPREPVMVLERDGETPRAYPLRYLLWHEIVNDEVGGVPVAVTFCPLCNSGVVFDRRLDGRTLEFGVSGYLRFSDMIMYDRETHTWWQQFNGDGLIGTLPHETLIALPAWLESWQSFAERNPDALVMSAPVGRLRSYGRNPYEGYDARAPFLYQGEAPPHGIDPVARVLRVGNRAWPLTRLQETRELTEAGYRITWRPGQASALDTGEIAEGREVGDIRVFDAETGANVVHEVIFAFAFHAFKPTGEWMLGN
ncbi:MAG: DUF3179 domain-containing protein [Paracoccaceae bacterium]